MRRIKEAEGSAASRNQLHCSRSPRKGGRKAVGAERDLHEACVEVACSQRPSGGSADGALVTATVVSTSVDMDQLPCH